MVGVRGGGLSLIFNLIKGSTLLAFYRLWGVGVRGLSYLGLLSV
jgi:hypothetical protein